MKRRNAHWLVAKTAREMAEELYEEYVTDNRFYAVIRGEELWAEIARANGNRNAKPEIESRAAFVRRMTQNLLEEARGVLAHMLTRYDVSAETKDQIVEALALDNDLRHGRVRQGQLIA